MKTRRSFLAAVAAVAAASPPAGAAASPRAVAAASPPAGAATPTPAPSAGSVTIAQSMRRFDAALSDDEVQVIAQAIDANNAAAKTLNPKKKRLKNGDAPAVRFAVTGGEG